MGHYLSQGRFGCLFVSKGCAKNRWADFHRTLGGGTGPGKNPITFWCGLDVKEPDAGFCHHFSWRCKAGHFQRRRQYLALAEERPLPSAVPVLSYLPYIVTQSRWLNVPFLDDGNSGGPIKMLKIFEYERPGALFIKKTCSVYILSLSGMECKVWPTTALWLLLHNSEDKSSAH